MKLTATGRQPRDVHAQVRGTKRLRNIWSNVRTHRAVRLLGWVGSFVLALIHWIPLSLLGAVAIVALVALGHLAFELRDRILAGALATGLILVGLCSLMVLFNGLVLRFRRERRPEGPLSLETEVPFRTGYRFGASCWNPLVKIEVTWQRPIVAQAELISERAAFCEEINAHDRAIATEVVRSICVSDVFGLARVRFRRRMPMEIKIEPHCGSVRPQQLFSQQISGDMFSHPDGKPNGDLIEMRRYVPGDPLKLVLWKLFARSGQLLVRTPEKVVAASRKTLVYLACAPDDEPAAGICRAVLKNSVQEYGLLFGTDGPDAPTSSVSEALDQIARSSSARNQGGKGLSMALAVAAQQDVRACVLFVPPQPGPWLEEIAGLLTSFRGQSRVIVGVDGLDAATPPGRWSRWLTDQQPTASWDSARLQETCQRLAESGADVMIVDRLSGGVRRPADFSLSNTKTKRPESEGVLSCR